MFSVHKGDTPCFRIINKKIIHLLHSVDSNITLSTFICSFSVLSLSLRSSSAEFRVYGFIEAHTHKKHSEDLSFKSNFISVLFLVVLYYTFCFIYFFFFCAHTRACVCILVWRNMYESESLLITTVNMNFVISWQTSIFLFFDDIFKFHVSCMFIWYIYIVLYYTKL